MLSKRLSTNKENYIKLQEPFIKPSQQFKQLKRLWYYWNYTHYKNIFKTSRFLTFVHYYNANDVVWKQIKYELKKLGLNSLFIKPKIARRAIIDTPIEPLYNVLQTNTLLFYSNNVFHSCINNPNKYENIKIALNKIEDYKDFIILCGVLDFKIINRNEIFELKYAPVSPISSLGRTFQNLPQFSFMKICKHSCTDLIRILKYISKQQKK